MRRRVSNSRWLTLGLIAFGMLTCALLTRPPAHAQEVAESEPSPTGINASFLDPDLNVSQWVERFEVESREVYHARESVVRSLGIRPGDRIADVGAGTGFFSFLFHQSVGPEGWVYSIDIAPKFLQHISEKAKQTGATQLTTVLGSDRSICLPPASVDLVFICDTYHHFESPEATLASIRRALKPGGTLVVIDFERIPGQSREFILGHVRAGKEVFRDEITEAGFRLAREINMPEFEENYYLRFEKE